MRIVASTILCCALTMSVSAGAQDRAAKKPEGGQSAPAQAVKPLTVTGCLKKGTEPRTFVLQNTEPKGPKSVSIVESKTDLQGYLGLKIEISGIAATEKELDGMKPKPSKGDQYIKVMSAKLITTACP